MFVGKGRGKPCTACAIIIDCEKERIEAIIPYDMTSSCSLQKLFHGREDSQQFLDVYDSMYKPSAASILLPLMYCYKPPLAVVESTLPA